MSLKLWDTFTQSARKFHSNLTEAASVAVMLSHFIFLTQKKKQQSSAGLLQLCCCWFQVRVVLMKTEHMCSIAFKDRHTQEVRVAAGSTAAVPYTLVPLAVGKLPVEVMVVGRGGLTGEDRIQKLLRVVVS